MAPKNKKTKMTLSDFLADETTGSWADEMDALPTAPAPRMDFGGAGRRDDFSRDFSGRESRFPPREELPLPTKPPYTAFLGNLAYDLTEADVEEFFAPHKLVSVKIIKERDDRPKGFGYVEFETLDGLKAGLELSGSPMKGRVVRVSVAEAQKDRTFGSRGGFGGEDDKFDREWRREGPLPDLGPDRSSSRPRSSRFSSEPTTNEAEDWRSAPRAAPAPPPERSGPSRRTSGFSTPAEPNEPSDWRSAPRPPRPAGPEGEGPRSRSFTPREPREPREHHAADVEENWTIGSKFKKTSPAPSESGFGPSRRGSRDTAPVVDEGPSDWRTGPRRGPLPTKEGRFSDQKSPQSSTPPTPASRRKLELLPRGSNSPSSPGSPVTSPPPTSATLPSVKSNPFGDAKPIDVTAREKEIEEKLAHKPAPAPKEKPVHEKPAHSTPPAEQAHQHAPPAHPSGAQDTWRRRGPPSERVTPSHSRQPSNGPGSSRGASRTNTPPAHSPKGPPSPGADAPPTRAPSNVRPTFSFAAAAASISIDEEGPENGKVEEVKAAIADEVAAKQSGHANGVSGDADVDAVASKVANLATNDTTEDAVKDAVKGAANSGAVKATDDDVEDVAKKIVDQA